VIAVNLSATQITDVGMMDLQRALPNLRISPHPPMPRTDAAVRRAPPVGVATCDEITKMTTDQPKQTRPQRRWYQYSLRTLVVPMAGGRQELRSELLRNPSCVGTLTRCDSGDRQGPRET